MKNYTKKSFSFFGFEKPLLFNKWLLLLIPLLMINIALATSLEIEPSQPQQITINESAIIPLSWNWSTINESVNLNPEVNVLIRNSTDIVISELFNATLWGIDNSTNMTSGNFTYNWDTANYENEIYNISLTIKLYGSVGLPYYDSFGINSSYYLITLNKPPAPTPESPPTQQSYSGGGGSSNTITETDTNSETEKLSQYWDVISKGKPTIYIIENKEWSLKEITLTTEQELRNVRLTIEKYKTAPKNILNRAIAYEYYKISSSESDFGEAKLTFKVSRQWIEGHNYKKENIRLFHFKNEWFSEATSFINYEGDFAIFEANTNSFSDFAIGYLETETKPLIHEQANTEEQSAIKVTKEKANGKILFVISGILIFSIFIYNYIKKSEPKGDLKKCKC